MKSVSILIDHFFKKLKRIIKKSIIFGQLIETGNAE